MIDKEYDIPEDCSFPNCACPDGELCGEVEKPKVSWRSKNDISGMTYEKHHVITDEPHHPRGAEEEVFPSDNQ